MTERLRSQLEFLAVCDDMKKIYRRTMLSDVSRAETDAEHSWHLAVMAMTLGEYAEGNPDIERVIRLVLVHDLVEIYAGDTFAYDTEGIKTKAAREAAAADRLFSLLPAEQEREFRKMWEEFEASKTPEAVFAGALDRFQPLINNFRTEGYTWRDGSVTADMVYGRAEPIKAAAPGLYEVVDALIKESIRRGWLREK